VFDENSFEYRPGRSAHDAIAVTRKRCLRYDWVVEFDIRALFDNVDHECLMKFLQHRIGDRRVLQLIRRFLKAGVIEDGRLEVADQGTPKGGVASPLLANVYLHYVLVMV